LKIQGCGTGKYLKLKSDLFTIGCDRSDQLCEIAREQDSYIPIIIADNLHLPYRDNLFDGVLSIGVIHHLATHKRRVQAIQGLFLSIEMFSWFYLISQIFFRMSSDFKSHWGSIINIYMGYGTKTANSKSLEENQTQLIVDILFMFSFLVKTFLFHVLIIKHVQV